MVTNYKAWTPGPSDTKGRACASPNMDSNVENSTTYLLRHIPGNPSALIKPHPQTEAG